MFYRLMSEGQQVLQCPKISATQPDLQMGFTG